MVRLGDGAAMCAQRSEAGAQELLSGPNCGTRLLLDDLPDVSNISFYPYHQQDPANEAVEASLTDAFHPARHLHASSCVGGYAHTLRGGLSQQLARSPVAARACL